MKTSDITLVFQGAFKPYVTRERDDFVRNIRMTRQVLPGARIVLSTWEGTDVPRKLGVDAVVLSPDPGPLAPLKLDDDKANNANRQLASTRAGLAAVHTPYAVKLRTDCFLEHAGFLDFAAEQRRRAAPPRRRTRTAAGLFLLHPRPAHVRAPALPPERLVPFRPHRTAAGLLVGRADGRD
ncbi:WavE lipopolysaccharide synthesis family protein [Massilia sp. LC238]|uniref:WavE lipopolysaccharide synthesis family protein n=1 Tax=Massilia sp. LC238 TaxID=1502852 RepID=UPI000AF650F0|nr:WavE lipopolysaccharide synthesis family protein [Massilia sp. LC238]